MKISTRAGFAVATGACVCLTGTVFAQGGDGPFDATTITSLPFSASGSTTALTNQFDAVCPYSGSLSPDSWYTLTPAADAALDVDICESAYDTKIYILDGAFTEIACNDDGCSDSSGNPFRSILAGVPVTGGTQYFIVVDGWSGDLGTYNINVAAGEAPTPCELECPGGSVLEGEPCDDTGGTDTNGGCNSSPSPLFFDVNCGDTVCGEAWGFGGTRDTDWYRLGAQGADTEINYSATAEFDSAAFYLGVNPDCSALAIVGDVSSAPCDTGALSVNVTGADETWWFMGFNDFDGLACGTTGLVGNDYILTWDCGEAIFPCPELGDSDLDGDVDFQDLLRVVANFGPCP